MDSPFLLRRICFLIGGLLIADAFVFLDIYRHRSLCLHDTTRNDDVASLKNNLLDSIDVLFPPQALSERMALSRKDGYWPFIQTGEDPPQEFVYGEFDVSFFCSVLDRAREIILTSQQRNDGDDLVFCDMGSGTGRLVLAAAAWHEWKLCRGIELLEGIHDQAVEKFESCRRRHRHDDSDGYVNDGGITTEQSELLLASSSNIQDAYRRQYSQYTSTDEFLNQLSSSVDGGDGGGEDSLSEPSEASSTTILDSLTAQDEEDGTPGYALKHTNGDLQLSPIELSWGSFDDPYEFFGDSDVIFVFSTAMPYHVLVNLARAVGRQCKEGCLVITTEYQLPLGGHIEPWEDDPTLPYGPYELELVESFTGPNLSVGGESTVFIHRVTTSYGTGEPFVKPERSVSDYAYKVVKDLDAGKLTPDPKTFLRNVSNQMAFMGLPDHWRPNLLEWDGCDYSDVER